MNAPDEERGKICQTVAETKNVCYLQQFQITFVEDL